MAIGDMIIYANILANWEWSVPCAIILGTLWGKRFGFVSFATVSGVGLMWLLLYCWTGDRRLYFPYTMQFAIQLSELWKGRVPWPAASAGGLMVGSFTLIRIWQGATTQVLVVELVVALIILIAARLLLGRRRRDATEVTIAAAVGSFFALLSLAL